MGSEFLAEYASLLRALQRNDKAQINALTMLADDNRSLADGIVRIIERHVLAVRRWASRHAQHHAWPLRSFWEV
jgi:hypothetical protein